MATVAKTPKALLPSVKHGKTPEVEIRSHDSLMN